MNAKFLAATSVLLNVALLGVALRTGRGAADARDAAAPGGVPPAASQIIRIKTNLSRVVLTETNEISPFRWSAVQSEDLKEFASNLLGVGCPHETVRAILESQTWQEFLPRRRALLEPLHRQYWNLAASGVGFEKASDSVREELDKLKTEILAKVDGIVGGAAAEEKERSVSNPHYDFLSGEKQRAVEELQRQFAQETRKLEASPKPTKEALAKRNQLRTQLQEKLRKGIRALMSVEELAEYDLRESRYAGTAQAIVGFEPTPEEARQVARIYQQSELADSKVDRKAPDAEARKSQASDAKKQREDGLKQALGEERYSQFKQGGDSKFGEIYRITERYELPRATAAQAADALKARSEAMARLRKGTVPQDIVQRTMALNVATRAEMLSALGERALRTYEKYHGPIIPIPETDSDQ